MKSVVPFATCEDMQALSCVEARKLRYVNGFANLSMFSAIVCDRLPDDDPIVAEFMLVNGSSRPLMRALLRAIDALPDGIRRRVWSELGDALHERGYELTRAPE